MRVNIINIPHPLRFPLLSKVDDNGVARYGNDQTGIHFLTKIQLEDVVEFHKLEDKDYQIHCGLFYNSGVNTTLRKFIKDTFEQRLKYKDKSSPLYNPVKQKLMKDVMNCFYGKCIQKPITEETKFFYDKEKKDNFIRKHYNTLLEVTDVNSNSGEWQMSMVKKSKTLGSHDMYCHIGTNMLSISKRIMNEVMCLAEDKGINIFYQDTDSMHIENDKIDDLAIAFKEKYDRELVGKSMGQFHSDFEFAGLEAKHSVELLALGKKTYIDIVECVDVDGRIKYENHYRFKGVPQKAIIEKAKDLDISILQLYKNLKYGGDTLEYNWSCKKCRSATKKCNDCKPGYNFKMNAGNKPTFECSKDFVYKTLHDTYRHASF